MGKANEDVRRGLNQAEVRIADRHKTAQMDGPEEIGKTWGDYELEDERSIQNGIDGVPEFMTWSDEELDRFFQAKSDAFKDGMLALISQRKSTQTQI